MFRQMEIGPLIGTKTWGGLVGTWDTPRFIDNGRMVAPRGGFYNVDGEWDVEGLGVAPDILVEQSPKLVIDGKDPQLEKAIQTALELLKTKGVILKSEPPAPPLLGDPSLSQPPTVDLLRQFRISLTKVSLVNVLCLLFQRISCVSA